MNDRWLSRDKVRPNAKSRSFSERRTSARRKTKRLLALEPLESRWLLASLPMSLAILQDRAFALSQEVYQPPESTIPIEILDYPPPPSELESVGLVFQEKDAITTANFLDQNGVYVKPHVRASNNVKPMRIFVDVDRDGWYEERTYEDAQADYSAAIIQPPINPAEIPAAGRVLSQLTVGAEQPGNGFPQFLTIGAEGYGRFNGYAPQVVGSSYRVAASNIFSLDGQPEEFPFFREMYATIPGNNRADLLGLVDSEDFTGAVSISIVPGPETVIEVDATWYPRRHLMAADDHTVAFLAYSSMFWKDELDTPWDSTDEAHDMDRLVVGLDIDGDTLPERIVTSRMAIPGTPGEVTVTDFEQIYGGRPVFVSLDNRDRNPAHYQAYASADYALRASYAFEILHSDVAVGLRLYEQHTASEYHDNIVVAARVLDDLEPAITVDDGIRVVSRHHAFFPTDSDSDGLTDLLGGILGTHAVQQLTHIRDAAVLQVPADYASIGEAVVAAQPGDVILVAAGTYTENLDITKNDLRIIGSGAGTTVLRGQEGSTAPVVQFRSVDRSVVFTGFTVEGGHSVWDRKGGGIDIDNASPVIQLNEITGNSSRAVGGGMTIRGSQSNPLVQWNHIHHNSTRRDGWAGYGGGIYLGDGARGEILDNNIEYNTPWGTGGGIYSGPLTAGGYLLMTGGGSATIRNNTITANASDWNGGIRIVSLLPGSQITVENNLILGNVGDYQGGAGISVSQSNVVIINNTIYGNRGSLQPGYGIYVAGSEPADIRNNIVVNNDEYGICAPTTAVLEYNLVWNHSVANYCDGTSPGAGSLSIEPQFVDPANGDFHLAPTSPAIDAGDPASEYADLNGTRNDLGAYGGPYPVQTPVSLPELTISSLSSIRSEGNSTVTPFTFLLTRTGNTEVTSSVHYAVTSDGAHPADAADFVGGVLPNGTLIFNAGEISKTITVNVMGDTAVEPDEGFVVELSNALSAQLGNSVAAGMILNDDVELAISAIDAAKAEGDGGSTAFAFQVTRSGWTAGTTTVQWTVSGSGSNPADNADFASGMLPGGTLTFNPGETSKTITVLVAGDSLVEADEEFTVMLSDASDAQITVATATGIILNDDVTPCTIVTSTADSGPGSLRNAIACANVDAGVQTITFNIQGVGPHTIQPLSALPAIVDAVVIDATTQPGYVGTPLIELDGSLAGAGTSGLRLATGGNIVQGLAINRFGANGILLQAGDGNTIQGNFLGTNAAGTAAAANGTSGIEIRTVGNTIGGGETSEMNLISGNALFGVLLTGNGANNSIVGNRIGTDLSGTAAVANGLYGVYVTTADNQIGGRGAGDGNLISGNAAGVAITGSGATGNVVQGNWIGVAAGGSSALPNVKVGVTVANTTGNTVGGTLPGSGNVLSGNGLHGVMLVGAGTSNNWIQGNLVGLDAAGTGAVSNGQYGITTYSPDNTIGGSAAGAGNVVSGNQYSGVLVYTATATQVKVQGNRIGTNAAGTAAIPNKFYGVYVNSTNNLIGGAGVGEGNLISGNTLGGIAITEPTARWNVVQGNRIGTNADGTAALGNGNGVTIAHGADNTIGGTVAGAGNQISGNAAQGVMLVGATATGNVVRGNLIGLAANGTSALGNGQFGVAVYSSNNTIGGVSSGNTISGNAGGGVIVYGATIQGTTIQGNRIGTDPTGSLAVPNNGHGLIMLAANSPVGGTGAGEGNVIGWNTGNGVYLIGADSTGNAIRQNSIFRNGLLGIDLAPWGPTANDPDDADTGPSRLQNFPEITAAVLNGESLSVVYSVPSSTVNSTYPLAVEFFVADTDGQEGQTYLGTHGYASPGVSATSFAQCCIPLGARLVATATDSNGNTSEFSSSIAVAAALLAPEVLDGATSATLDAESLTPVVWQAIAAWESAGLDAARVATLHTVTFEIADLPGHYLAWATPDRIVLDIDAAGYGWYIDPTPLDDEEYGAISAGNANSGSRPSTLDPRLSMDLLTAVLHEMGHILGLADLDDEDDLMSGILQPGTRQLPTRNDIDRIFADCV
jgi:hypothetical protein